MRGPPKSIIGEVSLPLPGTPSGGLNSVMRRRRVLARVASCSPDPYASFEWMCGPLECIFCELCLPLTGTPSGGRNSEMRVVEGWLGSHRVPLIHTHILSGCVAL